jgi:hypothetical protein
MSAKFPVFIVGAQRSGTTLLRMVLNAHSEIAIPEEARFLMPLLEQRHLEAGFHGEEYTKLVSFLRASEEYRLWNYDSGPFLADLDARSDIGLTELMGGLYGSFVQSEGKRYWGDKSLFFRRIDILARMFPQGSFIHIVRDGRDVFDSWRKMDASKDCAPAAALDWRLKLNLIERAFARLPADRALTIRFEDLLANAEQVARTACDFLGVDYEEGMLEFHTKSRRYVGDHHSQLIFKPIEAGNQSKWRNNLSHVEKVAFDLVAGRQLERYGYGRSSDACSLADGASVLLGLGGGGLRRAREVARDAFERRKALKTGTAPSSIKVGARPDERS